MVSPIKSIVIGAETFNYATNEILKDKLRIGDVLTLAYTDLPQAGLKDDFVIVKIIDKTSTRDVAVRVTEFAQALHLTTQEFKAIQKQAKLKEHLDKIGEREVKKEDESVTLIKVMTVAKDIFKASEKEYEVIEHGKKKFLAFKQDKDIKVVQLDEHEFLGKGSYGVALKLKNISDKTFEVIKIALAIKGKKAKENIESLQEEYKNLIKLYEETPDESHLIGWEEKPHQLVQLTDISIKPVEKAPETIGILKTLYDTDLMKLLAEESTTIDKSKLDPLWALDCCYQLIIGVARLHKKGYWNPDLAMENIFIKKIGDFLQIDICDLSDLMNLNEASIKERQKEFAFHADYITKKDYTQRKMHAHNQKKFNKFVERMNVFSLAAIMFSLFNMDSVLPYDFVKDKDGTEWADEGHLLNLPFLKKNSVIDEEFKNLLAKMLHNNGLKRPSALEVLNEFHELVKAKGHTELAAKYESPIAQLKEQPAERTEKGESPLKKQRRT